MKLKYHEDRSAITQQRRADAVKHMSRRINVLTQMRGNESSLHEMMESGRKISFLTTVRDTTARNLDRSLGGKPLDHLPSESTEHLPVDTIDVFTRDERSAPMKPIDEIIASYNW